LQRAWGEFIGPEATWLNSVTAIASGIAGTVGAAALARRNGADRSTAAVVAALAGDLVGGAYVNNTRACARWYERDGRGTAEHLRFAALHVHPAVFAALDRRVGRQTHPVRWSVAHYGYLMLCTTAIRLLPRHRRALGPLLTAGGLLLDRGLGPSRTAPWFAWTYYPKLVLGHAAAALWADQDLAIRR